MSRFNENIKHLLGPLYDEKVIVHYPLFANTYLLPYFYSTTFQRNKTDNSLINTDDLKLLKVSKWGNATWKEIIDVINKETTEQKNIYLFYSRDILGNDIIKNEIENGFRIEIKNSDNDEGILKYSKFTLTSDTTQYHLKKIDFCRYYPHFIFFDFSIDIFQELYCKKEIFNYNTISNFLTEYFLDIIPILSGAVQDKMRKFINNQINQINQIRIFSDTPEEAEELRSLIEEICKLTEIRVMNNITSLDLNTWKDKNTFNIYFYSAPYNIIFLKKKYQYLPFRLELRSDTATNNFDNFNTACYLISKEEFDADNKLCDNLDEFFKYVFWKAKETPEHFYDITKSFNFISATEKPAIIFENEYCFAKSISLFINPEDIKKAPKLNKLSAHENYDELLSKKLLFESLFNRSHNKEYDKSKNELLDKVRYIYSLIALNYLISNIEKIHLLKAKSFSSICEALQNTTFNAGFYNKVFELFIEYQVKRFVEDFNGNKENKPTNPIGEAQNKENKPTNPIDEAQNKFKLVEEKICQRLFYDIKYYFNQVLIKECQAEDVFLTTDGHKFVLDEVLTEILGKKLDREQKASFEHLKEIFTDTLEKCATYYEDIIELDHLGLASIFRTNTVKTLLSSIITMSPSIYARNE
ncbi:hypothetical protein FACS1894174_03990 [Bacteroidia bacterium]|nr:hypothetical protein FACS1894174_03990 [Bacteroidia bacterium]